MIKGTIQVKDIEVREALVLLKFFNLCPKVVTNEVSNKPVHNELKHAIKVAIRQLLNHVMESDTVQQIDSKSKELEATELITLILNLFRANLDVNENLVTILFKRL